MGDIMSTVGDNIFGYLSTFTVLMTSPICIIISLLSTQITKDDIPHTTEHPYVTQTNFFHLSTSTDWTPPWYCWYPPHVPWYPPHVPWYPPHVPCIPLTYHDIPLTYHDISHGTERTWAYEGHAQKWSLRISSTDLVTRLVNRLLHGIITF